MTDDDFVFWPGRYYLAMWFYNFPDMGRGHGDFTALVQRGDGPDVWNLSYRFRYYRSTGIWNSGDDRSWWSGTARGSEESLLKTTTMWVCTLAASVREKAETLVIKGDVYRLMELVSGPDKPSWLHGPQMFME